MRLANLAAKTADLDGLAAFFERAPGCSVRTRQVFNGVDFLELELAGTTLNAFRDAIYEGGGTPPLSQGWLHVSLTVDDLESTLASAEWARVLFWGPHVISGSFGRRRVAFFEPAPGLRIELMEELDTGEHAVEEHAPGEAVRDDSIFTELADAGATTVYEAAGQRGALSPRVRCVVDTGPIVGRALPARCQPGDNLSIHQAMTAAQPGDVLVVDGCEVMVGYLGDVLAVAAQARGLRGAVVDGGVRDLDGIAELGFPVWARGPAMRAATKHSPGSVGEPVVCGGVSVRRGDIVVADRDGVTVVPKEDLETVRQQVAARLAREEEFKRRLRSGELTVDLFGLR